MYLYISRHVGTVSREVGLRGRCALDCNKVSNKRYRPLRSTPELLQKAPNNLIRETPTGRSVGVKVTGAHSMEARQPGCEYLFRYVARGVSLVV
jgi:hypothetical protein